MTLDRRYVVTPVHKSMQLLARGLPLLISAMPRFLDAPFVIRFDETAGIAAAVDACVERFEQLQQPIEEYCEANAPESRLLQIIAR